VTVKTSFLGAHAVPPEFAGRADVYIDEVCIPTLCTAQAQGRWLNWTRFTAAKS
jgi:imidazolonepropionase